MTNRFLNPKSENDTDGILHHYKDKYNIVPSSTNLYTPRIQFITDGVINDSDWCSYDKEFSFFELDFLKGYTFLFFGYTFVVRSKLSGKIPKSWNITGNTGYNWIDIDEKVNYLSDSDTWHFDVNSTGNTFNKILFKQTEANLAGNHHFCIKEFEVFGILTKNGDYCSYNHYLIYESSFFSNFISLIVNFYSN